MKFRVIYQPASNHPYSPLRVVEQATGREIGWINRYLDCEYVCCLADKTLRIYAYNRCTLAVAGEYSSHRRGAANGPDRIDPAGVSVFPIQPAAPAFRFHHQ